MSQEHFPDKESLDAKFEALYQKARQQMINILLERNAETDPAEAELTANQMLQDRYDGARDTYDIATKQIENIAEQEDRHVASRAMLALMALHFSQGGYIDETTAERLAAVMGQLLGHYEDEEENGEH